MIIFFSGVGIAFFLIFALIIFLGRNSSGLTDEATAVMIQGLIFMVLCGIAALMIFR
jgi:hypothetical protein